ncbi:MAG: ParB N-terminal domain-containing protein [Pseudomonadota bacterium]|nr:ParB N-terminal domain-containing protein [Pseudomonadota bacterium]
MSSGKGRRGGAVEDMMRQIQNEEKFSPEPGKSQTSTNNVPVFKAIEQESLRDLRSEGRVVEDLDPSEIIVSPLNKRLEMSLNDSDEKYVKIKRSIAENGQDDPITVRKLEDNSLELLAGLTRMTACKELGRSVKALIKSGVSDQEAALLIVRENEDRRDFSPYEQSLMVKELKSLEVSTEMIKQAIGVKSDSAVSKRLKFANIAPELKSIFTDIRLLPVEEGYTLAVSYSKYQDKKLAIESLQSFYDVKKPIHETVRSMIDFLSSGEKKDPLNAVKTRGRSESIKATDGNGNEWIVQKSASGEIKFKQLPEGIGVKEIIDRLGLSF